MNKHIPHRFKTGSADERRKVLAGVLDTDGSLAKGGFELTLKSERLLDDVIFVARSLGFSANKAETKKTCYNNGSVGTYWRCNINGPVETIPTLIPRKQAEPRAQIKDPLVTGIKVESIGVGEYFGFEVFGSNRLFVLGDFTVTHNTVTFAHISANAIAKGKRAYIVAHREEIVDQISAALDRSGVRHGRIQPGHRQTDDPCQVAMVQTLARRLDSVPAPDLLTVDEAHHAVAGTWHRVAEAYQRARILGVTATPQRLDGRGLGDAFDVMVLGPTAMDLIGRGFLARYQYLAPPTEADTGGIKSRMGDYSIEELAALMDKKTLTGSAIGHYRQHLDGRPAIAFCVTVRHAENVAAEFREAGYRAASVDGAMDKTERRRRIAAIGNGELQILTSCELISEGVDVPVVAGAILLRPTQSLGLYLQQVGRCLRPKPDGSAAIILDHAGNVHRHGLPDKIHNWSLESRKKKPAADPVRTCEVCFRVFAVAPGWRAEADCGEGDRPVGCVLNAPEPVETALPEQVEGTLVPVAAPPAGPEWAGGIDMATAKGRDWYRLMELADTEPKLRQVAKARGYHWRWAIRRMEERSEAARKREAAAQEVPFVATETAGADAECAENEKPWPFPDEWGSPPRFDPRSTRDLIRDSAKSNRAPDIKDPLDEIISA